MIKEAIQYLLSLITKPEDRVVEVVDENAVDRKYIIDDQGRPFEVKPHDSSAQMSLGLRTLNSLIDYIKNIDGTSVRYFLHVEDETTVKLLGVLDRFGERERLITTSAIVPDFDYGRFHDAEQLIIALQSKFTKTDDKDLLLKVIGNVKEENVRNTGDNGFSQAVTIKTGVASADDVVVPNPVNLAPYRTFLEVDQPASDFIFRMKDGPTGAVFEADGGAWRNEAIANVKNYLAAALKEEIKEGRITIIA